VSVALSSPSPTRVDVEPIDDAAAWDDYVEGHPGGRMAHRYAWRHVFGEAFGRRATYLAARNREGRLAGILPIVWFDSRLFGRFGVSVPYLSEGGVLCDTPTIGRQLVEAARWEGRSRGSRYLELRHVQRVFDELPCRTHKVGMRLALAATVDAQWQALDRKVRNQVRKADKSGVTIARGHLDRVDDFYEVFVRNMRDLGTPVYGRALFVATCRRLGDRAAVFCAYKDGRPVAASLTLEGRDRLEVPWASALREFNPVSANVRLYWAMIEHAIRLGLPIFDFGRSTPDQGTYHFKRQWGAVPEPLHWEYALERGGLPDLSPTNSRYGLLIRLWRRLPVAVTRSVGPRIVRHIP
jgi:FemAB-related protein (PEP-CTERM system-associated)